MDRITHDQNPVTQASLDVASSQQITETETFSSKEEFIGILNAANVQTVLKDPEHKDLRGRVVSEYITNAMKLESGESWSEENKAAVFHFNGITAETPVAEIRDMLMTFAAFHNKDVDTLEEYIQKGVSAGVRLDYGLPLYAESYDCGEDIFVCSVKIKVGGTNVSTKMLPEGAPGIVGGVKGYVDSSFRIREILKAAPNKAVVQPNKAALDYIIHHAKTYRDSNSNPVIVFIPGVIDVEGLNTSDLIRETLKHGGNINDLGFFNVSGIVWSIIMGDVEATQTFLSRGAEINTGQEVKGGDAFGDHSAMSWATATLAAVEGDTAFENRMIAIIEALLPHDKMLDKTNAPEIGKRPVDYIPSAERFESLRQKFAA